MFDIGMLELVVIGIVALIVIGPKDLPAMFHTLGRFTAKARSMAREFTRAMEDAAKESGVDGIAKDINTIARPQKSAMNSLKDAASKFEKWDPMAETRPKSDKAEPGPHTQALSAERAETAQKIREATARKAEERIAREKAEAAAAADAPAKTRSAVPAKPAAGKTAAKKSDKKPPKKKPAASKPAASKAAAAAEKKPAPSRRRGAAKAGKAET